MKLFIGIVCFVSYIQLAAQNKTQIIKNLKTVLQEHCESNSYRDSEVFYNTEEKVLDIGGDIIDLDNTKLTYKFLRDLGEGDIHILSFTCKTNSTCIVSGMDRIYEVNAFFATKKSIYDVMDLIYALKKIE